MRNLEGIKCIDVSMTAGYRKKMMVWLIDQSMGDWSQETYCNCELVASYIRSGLKGNDGETE